MTIEECVALLYRYAEYDGIGIPNLAGCKDAMKMAADLLSQPSFPSNLDEAAEKCVTSIIYEYGSYDGDFLIPVCEDIFKAGAEWQKEQDDKLVDIIYQQGIEKGKDEMRETLKKKEK